MLPQFLNRAIRRLLRTFAPFLLPKLPGSSIIWGPPRRVAARFKDWLAIADPKTHAKINYVISSLQFINTPPFCVEKSLPKNLAKRAEIKLDPEFVAVIPGGRVVGREPAIIASDDTIILDLSMFFTPFHFDIFFSLRLPDMLSCSGPVLVLAGLPGDNYGHWLYQMLPRLHLAKMAGWKPDDFEKVIINDTPNNFAEESLLAAGFVSSQLIKVSKSLHIRGEPLVVPSIPIAGNAPEWVSDFLRSTYSRQAAQPHKRIYTSRANARWRKITNEIDLYPVLKDFGFEIVHPEKLDFLEGVRLFESAEVVCGMHGANLSNLCFCKPGSTLIEIYHPQHPEIWFWTAATGARLRYGFLLGEGPRNNYPDLSPGSVGNHSDTIVDPQKLRDTFLAAGLLKAEPKRAKILDKE